MRKRALLLGVSSFTHAGSLPGVPADFLTLSAVLRSPDGANFALVQQETGSDGSLTGLTFKKSIEQFLSSGARSELLLLYIGTHAVVDRDGALSFLTSEFDPAMSRATAIPAAFLASCVADCQASYVVIVIDTCFADAAAWELFSHRPAPFVVSRQNAPTFSVVATTRAKDPAIDGAFAPVLAEALASIDPNGDEVAVPLSRIFDEASSRLRETTSQFARKWESGDGAIPFGREHQGTLLSRAGVEELYASVHDADLLSGDDHGVFDFIETRVNRFGTEERVGIVLQPRGVGVEGDLSTQIAEEVRSLRVQGAIILADREDGLPEASLPFRTRLISFQQFRRRVQPIVGYLEEQIEKYEASNIYRYGYYVSVRAVTETRDQECVLDAHLDEWLGNPGDVNHLVVLGDFGTGKTTTAKRLFWRQARRYLQRPHLERVPVFVNLRHYNNIQQIEALVQRTLNEVRLNGLLTVDDVFVMNQDGRVLWILDGFDEMAAKVTPAVSRRNFAEIQRLLSASSRLVLTCRTHFFGAMEQVKDTFRFVGNDELYAQAGERRSRIMLVQAFSPEEIRQFVRARLRDAELSAGELTPEVLLERIGESRELTDLATRPILAEMIVFTLPDLIRKQLPLNLASLYREYTDNLLDRDAWRSVFADDSLRHSFPRQLAWHLFRNGKTELTFEEFPRYVKEFFAQDVQSYNDVLELIVAAQTTPLFQRDDAGNYAFAHKSFFEFYTARQLEEELAGGNSEILEIFLLTPEVLRFLAQLVDGNRRASAEIAALEGRTRFSFSYLMKRYLRVRFLPVWKLERARDPLQRKASHILLHLALPSLVGLVVGTVARVRPGGTFLTFVGWFVVGYAAVIAGSFVRYFYLTLRGRITSPIWRFNVGSISYLRQRKARGVPSDGDARMQACIRELEAGQRANAMHSWKTLQGIAVAKAAPVPSRRRSQVHGTPRLAAVLLVAFMGASVAAATVLLRGWSAAAALAGLGSVYGLALGLQFGVRGMTNPILRRVRQLGPAAVVSVVLLLAFSGEWSARLALSWQPGGREWLATEPLRQFDGQHRLDPLTNYANSVLPLALASEVPMIDRWRGLYVELTNATSGLAGELEREARSRRSSALDELICEEASDFGERLGFRGWNLDQTLLAQPYSREASYVARLFSEAERNQALSAADRRRAGRFASYFRARWSRLDSTQHLWQVSQNLSQYGASLFSFRNIIETLPHVVRLQIAGVLALAVFLHAATFLVLRRATRSWSPRWATAVAFFIFAGVLSLSIVWFTVDWSDPLMMSSVLMVALAAWVITSFVVGRPMFRSISVGPRRGLLKRSRPVAKPSLA